MPGDAPVVLSQIPDGQTGLGFEPAELETGAPDGMGACVRDGTTNPLQTS
jgi:hypothetical protein